MDIFDADVLQALASAGVMLGIAVLLLLTGKIIPRRTYEDMKEDRDHWREVFEESERARELLMQTLQSMAEEEEEP